jgi:hypothetical protein
MKSSAAGAGSFVGASSGSCDVKTVDFDLSVAVTPCPLGQSGLKHRSKLLGDLTGENVPGDACKQHLFLRRPSFAQAVEKALSIVRAPERPCQPIVRRSQPWHQV